jgi:hypothetical protein
MKKFILLFGIIVFTLTNQLHAQQWWNVGTAGFSAGQAY